MVLPSKISEEWAIKLSERESFFKGFLLFFVVIELFLGFVFYHYDRIEKEHLRNDLFLEMKNYAFSFDSPRFNIDIVPHSHHAKLYELLEDNQSLYLLAPLPEETGDLLKVYYPRSSYSKEHQKLHKILLKQFMLLSLIALIISVLFSSYVLKPLRDSIELLESFIKDLIHDLNTPLSTILINLKIIEAKSPELQSIERSVKTISMLHHNLNNYLEEKHAESERFDLKKVIDEQVAFFRPLYHHLVWKINLPSIVLYSDRHAFSRIIYNLISNACKYNINNGKVEINFSTHILSISNPSYGIKHPERIFERFYKEHERGLGIGLHIVEKLCRLLGIKKHVRIDRHNVTIMLDLSNILQGEHDSS